MTTFFETWQSRQPDWLLEEGPSDQIVIGTRARLHRNLAGFHFPTQARMDEKATILEEIGSKVSDLKPFVEGHFLDLTEVIYMHLLLWAIPYKSENLLHNYTPEFRLVRQTSWMLLPLIPYKISQMHLYTNHPADYHES